MIMAVQCFCTMATCLSELSSHWFPSVFPINYPTPCISGSAQAVCGVHRWKRSFHQVADGERPGLEHLLCRRRKLQGGCKQDFVSLLM